MAFDKNQPGPIVQPHKKTTQVNLFMSAAIVIFFIATAITVWMVWREPPQTPGETAPAGDSR